MNQVGTAFVDVKPDLSGFTREVNRKLAGQTGGIKKSFAAVGRTAAVGLAAGAAGFMVLGKSAIDAASDVNESLSKNEKLFGRHAKSVERFAGSSAKSYGISKKATLEYTGVFGNLFRALELSESKSADQSVALTKLAADMASFNNTSVEDALDAIRSGLVGETEPLRRFGVNMNDATLRAQALKMGLIDSVKEGLTPQQKAMAATALITKQTSQAHGDFARTSDGLANQQKVLAARFDDLKVTLGTALLPVVTDAVKATNKFATEFENGTGAGGRFREALGRVWEQLKPVIAQTLEVAKAVAKFVAKHPEIIKVAASLAAVGLAIKGIKFASKITGLSAFLSAARTGASTFQSIWARAGTRAGEAAAAKSAEGLADRTPISLAAREGRVKESLRAFGRRVGPALGAGIAAAALRELGTMLDRALGISEQARDKASAFNPNNAFDAIKNLLDPESFLTRAGGGWIGAPGEAGRDQVPVLLGRGEAVLNRHQQGPVESALRSAFGFGLDGLFRREQRPHYMAKGGKVTGDTDFLPSMHRALDRMSAATGVPIFVQSGRRTLGEQAALVRKKGIWSPSNPTGAAPVSANAPHVRGVAADITPGRERFGKIAGRYGLAFNVPGEPWHVALTGAGAVAGTTLTGEMRSTVARLAYQGFLGAALPGAVRTAARPFLSRIRAVAGMARGGRVGGFRLQELWRQAGGAERYQSLAAAVALAESGGNPGASNRNRDGSIDRGLWQINSVHGALSTFSQLGNAKAAVKLSKGGRDWSPWVAFKSGAYRKHLKASKRAAKKMKGLRGFEMTGKAGTPPKSTGPRTSAFRSLGTLADRYETDYLRATLTPDLRDDYAQAYKAWQWSLGRVRDLSKLAAIDPGKYGDEFQQAISSRDTWQTRVNESMLALPTSLGGSGGLIADAGGSSTGGMSQAERDQVLKEIRDQLALQNKRAAVIASTEAGVLAQAITHVVTGQIGGAAALSMQTPGSTGNLARY